MRATVRHRTKVTKGPGSKAAGIARAFKLIRAARASTDAAHDEGTTRAA